jgi:hypothetical protein
MATRGMERHVYWLDGEETCPQCWMRYAHAIELRCSLCDGPSCPDCVVWSNHAATCVACGANEDEGAEA